MAKDMSFCLLGDWFDELSQCWRNRLFLTLDFLKEAIQWSKEKLSYSSIKKSSDNPEFYLCKKLYTEKSISVDVQF